MTNEFFRKTLRFSKIYITKENLEELDKEEFTYIPNPSATIDNSKVILIDLAYRKYTYLPEGYSKLGEKSIEDLNQNYLEESLEDIVKII